MATIVTRAGKGSALTFAEGDANFTNLNDDKLEASGGTITGYAETIYNLGTTDTPSIDVANGNVQTVTITTELSLPNFTNAVAGQSVTLIVTGNGTATSNTGNYKFANAGNTTLTNYSIVSIFYDGTTYWTSISTDYV